MFVHEEDDEGRRGRGGPQQDEASVSRDGQPWFGARSKREGEERRWRPGQGVYA